MSVAIPKGHDKVKPNIFPKKKVFTTLDDMRAKDFLFIFRKTQNV